MMGTILVADDEAEILELIEMILEGDGLDILTAHDGLEALEIARKQRPDLVLADVMMPRMGGIELTSRLREDPETRGTVVLLMSAARQVDLAGSGAQELIRKPFDILRLSETVRHHVGRSIGGSSRRLSSGPCPA